MIINLKSQTDLSGFYVVYEGSTNLESGKVCLAFQVYYHIGFYFYISVS